ncbi:peroxisomal trans-2-enoyl-CoA reductase-like [Tigriopus californicus]|uniref:peroxisomal trans-2-enoyl-CoA reductase-like n=1 Tax=Tigriopus californicus TaxID=6832 RepID=UPI0027DA83B1|nr:peroxisomal trans-2-enoyl-CoA reductase-like [Tigriopus californicus]
MSVFRPGLFTGRVALVTGGGSGIGKAIAHELLTLGCQVSIASRNLERLDKAVEELRPRGDIQAVQCNIRNEEDVRAAVTSTLKTFGRLDYLVNNGGGQFPALSEDITLKGWKAVIETNLTGTFLMTREVYRQHFEEHGGVVINIVADMFRGFPMMSHTGAARAAVENLTKSWATEWAENGVRVNAVAPGIVFSPSARDNYSFDVFSEARSEIPAKRLGTPEEVSSAVCFLLSPGASFINGATLRVDAGGSLYSKLMKVIPEHSKMPAYKWQEDGTPASKL